MLAAVVATGIPAFAASLNGLTAAPLGAWNVPGGTGAPTVLTWASFTFPNNTNLDGAALDGGGTWIADIGTWRVQANEARVNKTSLANISVDVGTNSASVSATLTFGPSARAGVMALDNGGVAFYALYSKTGGGTIQLYKYSGGQVLRASTSGIGTPASAAMRLDARTNDLTVSWNGSVVLSYTLTGPEIGAFKSGTNTRFGIIADNDNLTRFDDFHVDT